MAFVRILARGVLMLLNSIYSLIPKRKGSIPEPGFFLHMLLDATFGDEKLYKLEYLTDLYKNEGLFRYDKKIYIFEPKLTQTVINKLEKGAEEYLKNSPLKDTFLGSSSRSPEVRRAIAAVFRKNTLEENGQLIIQDVQNMCDRMQQESESGKPVNITHWALRMAMDVVGHMLLQLNLYALEGTQEKLLECLMTILHRCYALAEITAESEEFKEANNTFEKLTSKILEKALQIEDEHSEKRLVVKLHGACGFDQARDNMKLFLMAGSETTAATMPVLFYLFTSNINLQEELRQEADDNIENLYKDPATSLPKIEAVMKEVLRVYPIAPFISRRTYEPVKIGDITLDAHSDIIAFTWGIHRSQKQWTLPKDFVPFRFLDSHDRSNPSMYIPFGAGSRICIGQHLAWLEIKLAIAFMLHRFNFTKVPETADLKFVVDWVHAVVHPDRDMYFKLDPR